MNRSRILHEAARRRQGAALATLGSLVLALAATALLMGAQWYGPDQVLAVLLGADIQGASFAVGEIRLPRMLAGLLVGIAFGMGGATFQTMLRNPLASPDIIGISAGASLAAVFAILELRWSGPLVSLVAVAAGLGTSAGMLALAWRGHFSGARLVLVGIGFQALAYAGITWLLAGANQYDIPAAMRWLSGSLNGIRPAQIPWLTLGVGLGSLALLVLLRTLPVLALGDQTAESLGVPTRRARFLLSMAAVLLVAVACATSGPVAFVSFLAGPLVSRFTGPGPGRVAAAGLAGAILVLGADLLGQYALPHRYPAGVITGLLGAPYLVLSLMKLNKAGTAS